MAKMLLVGDVHATADELDDCNKLVDYIEDIITNSEIDYLVFLGDQFHNHAILNTHVLNFWKETFIRLKPLVTNIICLVGNHDLPGNTGKTNINSMSTLDHLCLVVDGSFEYEGTLFVGFQHNSQKFIDICQKSSMNTVICHQTFQGATYENGFYAKDGIDLNMLPKNQKFISGHIHSPQSFDRVRYIGAPRWRTASDGDVEERYLEIYNSDTSDLTDKCFPTGYKIRRIFKLNITPNNLPFGIFEIKNIDIGYINLIGPKSWIDNRKTALNIACSIIIKETPTDSKPTQVKESEGIDIALVKYLESSTTTTSKEVLRKLIEERIWNKR